MIFHYQYQFLITLGGGRLLSVFPMRSGKLKVFILTVAFGSIITFPALAQESEDEQWTPFNVMPEPPLLYEDRAEMSFADKLWSLPILHRNENSLIFQEVRLTGRYHGQYAWVRSKQGDFEKWENRRVRGGVRVDLLQEFRFRMQFRDRNEDAVTGNPVLEDFWLAWRPSDEFVLKVGQFKPLWSFTWGISSDNLRTFERTQFVDQFRPRRALGVGVSGEVGTFGWGLAVFSGNTDEGISADDGNFFVANVGGNAGDLVDFEQLRWRFDYLYNNDSDRFSGDRNYQQGFAASLLGEDGRWSGMIDIGFLTGLKGAGNEGNAFGIALVPSYDLIEDKLQLVARYEFSRASNDDLSLKARYEQEVVTLGDLQGNLYHAFYTGFQWFLRGNQLKFLGGAEWARMRDSTGDTIYEGWTFITGVRLSF